MNIIIDKNQKSMFDRKIKSASKTFPTVGSVVNALVSSNGMLKHEANIWYPKFDLRSISGPTEVSAVQQLITRMIVNISINKQKIEEEDVRMISLMLLFYETESAHGTILGLLLCLLGESGIDSTRVNTSSPSKATGLNQMLGSTMFEAVSKLSNILAGSGTISNIFDNDFSRASVTPLRVWFKKQNSVELNELSSNLTSIKKAHIQKDYSTMSDMYAKIPFILQFYMAANLISTRLKDVYEYSSIYSASLGTFSLLGLEPFVNGGGDGHHPFSASNYRQWCRAMGDDSPSDKFFKLIISNYHTCGAEIYCSGVKSEINANLYTQKNLLVPKAMTNFYDELKILATEKDKTVEKKVYMSSNIKGGGDLLTYMSTYLPNNSSVIPGTDIDCRPGTPQKGSTAYEISYWNYSKNIDDIETPFMNFPCIFRYPGVLDSKSIIKNALSMNAIGSGFQGSLNSSRESLLSGAYKISNLSARSYFSRR